jgi:very-short-patch-repair endonuclease
VLAAAFLAASHALLAVLCASIALVILVAWAIALFLRGWFSLDRSGVDRAIRRRDATSESPLERRLADALDSQRIPYEREFAVSRMHVDFAFPHAHLAVECDGIRYHGSADARARDARRDAQLARYGWRVLRFTGDEIHSDIDGCIRKIRDAL